MPRLLIQTIYDDTRAKRVLVFQREDGSFGFEEEHFSSEPLEQAWIPLGRFSGARCDTAERAIREAHGRVSWLTDTSQEPYA